VAVAAIVDQQGRRAERGPADGLGELAAFRQRWYGCLGRRADALFELTDALLCAPGPVGSLPQLSLEPAFRRGWGSLYGALACGSVDAEATRDLLAAVRSQGWPLVFAIDQTSWPRCDAETSPQRGIYYHPSRHSAGQPVVAGWCYQWACQLGWDHDSWTAPVDARRIRPAVDPAAATVAQVAALLGRLGATPQVPLLVFDAGYDPVALTVDLAELRAAVLVRIRSDRVFYADPPQRPPGTTGRPRKHGQRFACQDPATWPAPVAALATTDDRYGQVVVQAWSGLHPKLGRVAGGPRPWSRRWCAGPSSGCRSAGCPSPAGRSRCCGCGGPARAARTWTWSGGRTCAGLTSSTPCGFASRRWGG